MIPDLKELKTWSTQESTGYRGSAKIQRQEGDHWVALVEKASQYEEFRAFRMGKNVWNERRRLLGVENVVRKHSGDRDSEGFVSDGRVTRLITPEC